MLKTSRLRRWMLLAPTLLAASSAWAGGLWLSEFGAPAMGRAGAGAEAGVDDASTTLYNPASMTRLDGARFMATAGFIWSETEFDIASASPLNGTESGGDAGGVAPSASAFYVRPLNDRWWFGTSFYGVTGSTLDYKDNWVGRFQATDVDLLFLGLQPNVGYQVNEQFSIGAGVLLGYTELELILQVPNAVDPLTQPEGEATIDGDDFEVGWSVGAMWTPSENTRVGLVYQSGLEPKYSGGAELDPPGLEVGVETELPLAAFARVGITHQFTPRWAGHLTFGWEDWDTLEDLLITTQNGGLVAPRNWDDTYHYAAGVTHTINDRWNLQGGIAYDTNPADKELRTADLPIDRQVRYAFGLGHTRPDGNEIAAQIVYADYGSARIDARGFAGEYEKNDIVFFSVSFNWALD